MLARASRVLNEAMAHAERQCHAYRDVIRNDRIALSHWSNSGADKCLTVSLQEHLSANLEHLTYWETFLVDCGARKYFTST